MKCVSFTLTDINECYGSPCENGGTCEDQVNGYTCHCQSGYSGDHCQTGKAPSLIVSCDFFFFSFTLLQHCFFGFRTGISSRIVRSHKFHFNNNNILYSSQREIKFIYPSIRSSNHPSITDSFTHTRFQTKMKIIIHLQCNRVKIVPTDINECDSSPCENGGTCEDQVNGYTCHCLNGYSGDHCQTGRPTSLSVVLFLFFFFPLHFYQFYPHRH